MHRHRQRNDAPRKILIENPDTGRQMDADVISYSQSQIVAAIYGSRIVLYYVNDKLIYEGKMAGMTLIYRV